MNVPDGAAGGDVYSPQNRPCKKSPPPPEGKPARSLPPSAMMAVCFGGKGESLEDKYPMIPHRRTVAGDVYLFLRICF